MNPKSKMFAATLSLAVAFIFGAALAAIIFLSQNREKISSILTMLRPAKPGAENLLGKLSHEAKRLFESLSPPAANSVALRCVGPAFRDIIRVGLPWGQVELSAPGEVVLEIRNDQLTPPTAGPFFSGELSRILDGAASAAAAKSSDSHLFISCKGPRFAESLVRVKFPWGEADLDLSQTIGIPVANCEGKLEQSGPAILF